MSSSFSIEISGEGDLASSKSHSSSVSKAFDLSPSEPSSSGQPRHRPQPDVSGQGTAPPALSGYAPDVAGFGSVNRAQEPHPPAVEDPSTLAQQAQQEQQVMDPHGSSERLQPFKGDALFSPPRIAEELEACDHGESSNSFRASRQHHQTAQKPLSHVMPPSAENEHRPQWDEPRGLSAIEPTAGSSFRASACMVPPRRVSSTGHPYEGILKRRTEKWTEQSTWGEDVVISSQSKLWVAPGSVLWRFFLCTLAARIGSSLALLVVVLTTLGRMGKAVSCVDMSNCVGGGGIMAFPILLRALPTFGTGIEAYEAITESMVAGMVLILVAMAGNCYYTCQALLKGTKKAYLEEVRMTTCCTAWVGACVGAFIPPTYFTEQFCDAESFDVNSAYRDEGSPTEAASRNMCDQVWFARSCVGVALLCMCSTALLLFQRYSRFWAALLGLGCLKFMLAGFVLCFTIAIGGQGNEMMLETMDKSITTDQSRLYSPMVTQLGLMFAALKWGGCILAISNLACGAFTIWAAHLRSHLLSCTNMVANFVFFFVNAVSFFAMLFEFATLRMVCNYQLYPMEQSRRAVAEAALFCTIKPKFLFVWFLVALLAFIHLAEFFLTGVLFHREFGKAKTRTRSLMSVPSIDSLPPRWGVKR